MSAQPERSPERAGSGTEVVFDLDSLRTPLHKPVIPAGVYPPWCLRPWLHVKSSVAFARFAGGFGL